MNIINVNYSWNGELTRRSSTSRIVLHHLEAVSATPADIHQWHKDNGWAGIGYNYYIRKDGNIYTGRPEWAVGAHTKGYNEDSIGIAFEGNFEREFPTRLQILAGIELIQDLRKRYGELIVFRHRDLNSTSCPGKYFSEVIITEGMKNMSEQKHWADNIFKELTERIGLTINEKRFDDNIKRGEVFALLLQALNKISK